MNVIGGRGRGDRQKLAAHSELVERLKICLQFSSDLFLHLPPGAPSSDEEEHLFEFYVYFLVSTAKDCIKDSRRSRKSIGTKTWNRLIYACRDKVRLSLAHLVAFVLFPAAPKLTALNLKRKQLDLGLAVAEKGGGVMEADWVTKRQLFVARALAHEVQYKQMLKSLLDINLDYQVHSSCILVFLFLIYYGMGRVCGAIFAPPDGQR